MLDGQIQIRHHVRLFRQHIQQLIGDAFRITVQHTHPADAVDVTQLPEQFRQSGLAVQVAAVPGGILCNYHQFCHVMLCQPVCLFQHILHGDAAVRATDGRDGAVGTVVGTALGDFQIGEKRQGGDNAVTLHFGIALLAETHHSLAGENVVENIHNVPVVADADDSICLCEQLRRLFFIALGETSGEDDLFQRAVFFQRTQFQDGLNGFFFGGLNESAGVDNGNFRLAGLCHKLIAVRTQLCQHTLGIYQILGTSQRDHAHTNWHSYFPPCDCFL